ncbi:glycosyltransferase family 4 protein [Treponema socranskii]|uniref:glycosyltransferase family 4 protein n=1 Tax=Treponema socranskii TaxID=53419 RepID=UPI003D6FA68F
MKKILFLSNTANFSKFNLPYMRWFHEQGWRVDYCSAGEEFVKDCDNQYTIDIARSPFSLKNLKALKQLKKLLAENRYDILHCHTPMGGVLGRFAAKKLRYEHKIKIIYTAHGFHFYKGAPLLNWLFYYPVEKHLAKYTDVLVTINKEDYECVVKKRFYAEKNFRINGVGVNITDFKSLENKHKIRQEYGYTNNDFIILYTAEFIPRKNHRFLIESLPRLKKNIPNLKIILPGKGELFDTMVNLAKKLYVDDIINFCGYRKDINKLCGLSDLYVATSKQEGLPIGVVEAIATGLPVVVSNIRGHNDIIQADINGSLYQPDNKLDFINKVIDLYNDREKCLRFAENSVKTAEKYSTEHAVKKMAEIYTSLFTNSAL